eukprot:6579319-Lingulodinium_polyedra.AAC.1
MLDRARYSEPRDGDAEPSRLAPRAKNGARGICPSGSGGAPPPPLTLNIFHPPDSPKRLDDTNTLL